MVNKTEKTNALAFLSETFTMNGKGFTKLTTVVKCPKTFFNSDILIKLLTHGKPNRPSVVFSGRACSQL